MPVPTPRRNEGKNSFMSRCIKFLMKEGERPQNQTIAICYSQWRKKEK